MDERTFRVNPGWGLVPMDKVSISYQNLVAGFDEPRANRAEEEKQLFFNGVARDFYRTDSPPTPEQLSRDGALAIARQTWQK